MTPQPRVAPLCPNFATAKLGQSTAPSARRRCLCETERRRHTAAGAGVCPAELGKLSPRPRLFPTTTRSEGEDLIHSHSPQQHTDPTTCAPNGDPSTFSYNGTTTAPTTATILYRRNGLVLFGAHLWIGICYLLRKRAQLVRYRTAQGLSIQNLVSRNTGRGITMRKIRELDGQIRRLEAPVLERAKLKPGFEILKSVPGIGDILGLTIMYEAGDMGRFETVGRFASYARCVSSSRWSNGKKKGEGTRRSSRSRRWPTSWPGRAITCSRRGCASMRRVLLRDDFGGAGELVRQLA